MRRAHRSAGALLLVIAVVALLGHVCVLPVHAHAEMPGAHHSHAPDGGDAVHAASCEAVRGSAPAVIPALAVARADAGTSTRPVATRVVVTPPAPDSSPPLFLRHAALLI